MKKSYFAFLLMMVLALNVFAQKTTKINGTIQNNKFSKVELLNSYGDTKKFGSAEIKDNKFTLAVDVPQDIYRLDFGQGAAILVVLTPGENININLDAENIQKIQSVTGSESMNKVKQISDYSFRRREVLDSINEALQNDPDKIYWSSFTQNFNSFRQTNDDVDEYLAKAFDNTDSISTVFSKYMPDGKVSGKNLRVCADELNKWLKKLDINYAPFASYLENVNRYYDFSGSRVTNAQNLYSEFDQYMAHLSERHDIAKNSIGSMIPKVKELLAVRDSLAFNNLLDKKNLTSWLKEAYSKIHSDIRSIADKSSQYNKYVKDDAIRADKLVVDSQVKIKEVVQKYQSAFDATDNYLTARMKDEIKQNKDELFTLMFIDMFPREQNAALHNEVFTALHSKYPDHPIVKERWNIMNSPASKVNIGAIAPELEFPNPDGKMLKLSDLRGKVVLIDFWASWCGPCRKENPNVTNIYRKYHDKGFEIFSVSLDSDAASWKRAIETDKLVWPNHVSDLKKWQSQAAAIYNVRSIPSTFLLDKEGRIVQKNLRGADLENAVKQLLEQ